MAERPEYFPEWAVEDAILPNTGNINKQRPKETLRLIGFDKGQEPSAEEFNWLFNNVGKWVEFLEQEISEGISSTRDVNVFSGNGLTGGGNLAGDITLSLGTPSTITANSGNTTTVTSHTHAIDLSGRVITGTNGLVGGGNLGSNRTISMGTPSTISPLTTNSATGSTHTHTIDLSGRSISAGNGLTGGGSLDGNVTINLGTPGTISPFTGNTVTGTSHTHAIDFSSALPSGMIAPFAGSTPPGGWLKADGAIVSRTEFASLFAAIGTTYGAGDGTSTFKLPDLRGEFIRGWDDGRGVDSGRGLGSTQTDQNKSHTHSGTATADGSHSHSASTSSTGSHTHTVNYTEVTDVAEGDVSWHFDSSAGLNQGVKYQTTSSGGAHSHSVSVSNSGFHSHNVVIGSSGGSETRPRNIALMYCIKA